MAFVLAVTNQKGGVGKTTTAVNVAAALAGDKRSVLLIDLDPQGNATSSLGIDKDSVELSTLEVIMGEAKLSDAVLPTAHHNLFVLPANTSLAQAEIELVSHAKRERQVVDIIDQVSADLVIIDCPPALGLLTVNALTASDGVLIPVQAEYFALEGLGQLLRTIQLVRRGANPRLEIFGVVLTMVNRRTVLSEQVQAEVAKHFKNKLFETTIPRNIRLAEAPSFGKTIFVHDKWSKGAKAYKALAKEIAKRAEL